LNSEDGCTTENEETEADEWAPRETSGEEELGYADPDETKAEEVRGGAEELDLNGSKEGANGADEVSARALCFGVGGYILEENPDGKVVRGVFDERKEGKEAKSDKNDANHFV